MEGSILIRIYKTLTPEERQAFAGFAQAALPPQAKIRSRVIALVRVLEAAAPHFEAEKIAKKRVEQVVFQEKRPPEGALGKVMVEANRLLKSFLLLQHAQSQTHYFRRQTDWLDILDRRNLADIGELALNKLAKEIPAGYGKTPAELYDKLLVEMAVFSRQTKLNRLRGDLNVPATLQALDTYYHFTRLELLNHFLLQQRVTNLEIPEPIVLAPPIPAYAAGLPGLNISEKISLLLQQEVPPKEEIIALLDLLRKHEDDLPPDQLKQFYTYLRNFCTILINAGVSELLETYHQLQKDNLERGYLYYQGTLISGSAYISVAIGAIRARNLDWCRHFIEEHRGRVIGENESSDLYRLNMAQYFFAAGAYETALDYIPHSLEVLNYSMLSKRLEIKILYELQSDLLPYKVGAFKTYTSRASGKYMPPGLRKINREFVNLVLQFMHAPVLDKTRAGRLMQRILSKPQVAEREWLLEKASAGKR